VKTQSFCQGMRVQERWVFGCTPPRRWAGEQGAAGFRLQGLRRITVPAGIKAKNQLPFGKKKSGSFQMVNQFPAQRTSTP